MKIKVDQRGMDLRLHCRYFGRPWVVMLLLALSVPVAARELHVAMTGRDTAIGTQEQPFKTIQKGVDAALPGDVCVVHAGTYRETVKMLKSGDKDNPIRIIAEGEVVLDGTAPIIGSWVKHEGNILKTRLPGPAVEQAFSGGGPLSPARWPNAAFKETWIRSKWAKAAKGAKKDLMICEELAATGIDWTGAIAVLNVGHQYKTWTREILTHGAGKDRFTYSLEERLGDGKDDGAGWWNDRFYITGTIKALDAPGEFYHDAKAGWFYYVTMDGQPPAPGSIQVKRRDYAILGTQVHDVQISGFKVLGCTIRLTTADRIVIEKCDIRFPAFKTMIGETMPKTKERHERFSVPVTSVIGNDNVIRGCSVAYSSGEGILASGLRNRIEDCIVHDVCWSGTINYAGIRMRGTGKDMESAGTVSRCTVYNVGNVGIYHQGHRNTIEYNLVHHAGLACHDIAAIHSGGPSSAGSVVHHNIVHHSMGKGIRGDDQTRQLTVHHNLVYLCDEGIIVKGDQNRVYNNTILGYDGHGVFIIPTRQEPKKWWTPYPILPVQNGNSMIFNNYVGMVSYRHKPLPQNKGISHNIAYDGKTPFEQTLVRADKASLEAGIVDARPRDGSPLLNAGRALDDRANADVAPDVGAFDHGRPAWTAGAKRAAPKDIALRTEAEVARSWNLAGKSGSGSVPLPRKILDSNLNELSKRKLQKLFDACWQPGDIKKRKDAIQKRNQQKKGSAEFKKQQAIVQRLHTVATKQLMDRAADVLAGTELKRFYDLMGQ